MVHLPMLWRHSGGFSQVQGLGELLIGRIREVFEGSIGEPIETSCFVGDSLEDGLKDICCYFKQRGGLCSIQQGLANRGGSFNLSPNGDPLLPPGPWALFAWEVLEGPIQDSLTLPERAVERSHPFR